MTMELNVSLDPRNLAKFRRLMRANRLVAAQSLTFTAEKAKPAWKVGNQLFHRRNRWLDAGVRMRAATPSNLVAQVGTLDRFFGRHVIGIDAPKEGKLFVPLYDDISKVGTHQRIRAMLRRMDGTQRKPFLLKRGGQTFLARRLGKARGPLTLLGKMQQGAKIAPRFDAVGIVDGVVQRDFSTTYERLLLNYAATL